MVFPAIDLQRGRVVQLIQGETQALERDLDEMLEAFRGFPALQVIDLDAAKGEGENRALVERCCNAGYRVRVGGGVRTLGRGEELLQAGADKIIVSSAAFDGDAPNLPFLESLNQLGRERVIIAIDSRRGHVATHGWRRVLSLTTIEAAKMLSAYCGEFLFTSVDTEGLMQGIPLELVRTVKAATENRLTVAGGISTLAEIEALEKMGVSSVLGMAIYTGKLKVEELLRFANGY